MLSKISHLESFYASKVWREFRVAEITRRIAEGKGLRCEVCGEPITEASTAHAHHITELNEANFRDATISLNPDNIQIVHGGCHNKLHSRFDKKKRKKKVYIVYGMPCSGKTTYVLERKERFDIVLDMDRLYQAITLLPPYEKPDSLFRTVRGVYNLLIDNVKTRTGKWRTAWVIGGLPDKYQREKLAHDLGAELVFVECERAEAIERLRKCLYRKEMVGEYIGYIDKWIERYTE